MAERTNGSGSNTTIVVVVVLLLIAVVVFLFFFRPADIPQTEDDGPDIELEVTPPDEGSADLDTL